MNNKEVSMVKTAEAFNNYFLNMAGDLQVQIVNWNFTSFTPKEYLSKWLFTDEYNSCNRRKDTKFNTFPESKIFYCIVFIYSKYHTCDSRLISLQYILNSYEILSNASYIVFNKYFINWLFMFSDKYRVNKYFINWLFIFSDKYSITHGNPTRLK